MHDTTTSDHGQTRSLMVPLQSTPIDRTPAGAAAFGSEAGVEASIDWGNLGNSIMTGLGAVGI